MAINGPNISIEQGGIGGGGGTINIGGQISIDINNGKILTIAIISTLFSPFTFFPNL